MAIASTTVTSFKFQSIYAIDEAAFKLAYLAMRNISKKWTRLDSRLETRPYSPLRD
ncbi:hypothetical protein [Pseudanabaena sp. SR411]|uniref:hypothetical protein n=1 Tax=Pseudanabaena sp. SR411 TaxID=1980935 RepID=UPI00159553C9|nr:hypothetical protein [Pseudanabaena sp. SR411]